MLPGAPEADTHACVSRHWLCSVQHDGATHCVWLVWFCGRTHAWLTTVPPGQLTRTHWPALHMLVSGQSLSLEQAAGQAESVTVALAAVKPDFRASMRSVSLQPGIWTCPLESVVPTSEPSAFTVAPA